MSHRSTASAAAAVVVVVLLPVSCELASSVPVSLHTNLRRIVSSSTGWAG